MTDLDRMLVAACNAPADATVRSAAADAVLEWGDPMLAHAIEDDGTGPKLLEQILSASRMCGLPVSVNLAWAQHHVISRMASWREVRTGIAALTAQQMSAEEAEVRIREMERESQETQRQIEDTLRMMEEMQRRDEIDATRSHKKWWRRFISS